MRAAAALLILGTAVAACGGRGGEGEAPAVEEYSPGELALLVEIDPVVNEYFHLRKQAVLRADAEVLWARFPALRQSGPVGTGVNDEGRRVMAWGETDLLDGDVLAETDPRFPVEFGADTVALHVRGRETYLRPDFRHSGSELTMTLVLRRGINGWDVVRTDEVTDEEAQQRNRR